MNRVVVTGVGGVTPVGIGREEIWENIKNGVSGIGTITRFDPTDFAYHVGAEVKDFQVTDYIDKKEATCLYSMRLPELKWLLRTQNLIWTVKTQLE